MPDNYKRHPEAGDLPEKTRLWIVQNSGKPFSGVISSGYNFEGGWDDESLVAGYNENKTYAHTAIGRHGNFLQWGYGEPPSRMTESGRKLLINGICYIKKFAGRTPIARRQMLNRRAALALGANAFSDELTKEYQGREKELIQLHKDNVELLRYEQKQLSQTTYSVWFSIDHELKDLGITSNRRVSTLEQLIEMLSDETDASGPSQGFFSRLIFRREQGSQQTTALKLLKRYTNESFDTKTEWQAWLETNRDRLFFSDFGGYKFYVVPESYLDEPRPPANEALWFPK